MAKLKKIRLGDLLVKYGVISEAQLGEALRIQQESGKKLGKILVERGLITEQRLLEFLADQLDVELVDLAQYRVDPDAAHSLSESQARRFRALPLKRKPNGTYQVAMADPTNVMAVDRLEHLLGAEVEPAVASESALLRALDRVFTRSHQMSSLADEIGAELGEESQRGLPEVEPGSEDAPVARLINALFTQAVQMGSSDIHVEPDEDALLVRCRIDGVLQERMRTDRQVAEAVVSRLKLMAELDIAERRLPQDGRFRITVGGHRLDVRLSTMPIQNGEAAVMRLLDQSAGLIGLEELGMEEEVRRRFEHLVRIPHGMVLVTGPTGSGKTTTLYAALNRINDTGQKIITVEDPVEYQLPLVSQVQVNPRIDLTFARVLRSILRQDPDTVMVGEIRDQETGSIAIRAALTGHLVFSTLHTNDAPGTVTRLIDMGLEPFLVASSLRGVVAQRLVRRICPSCRVEDRPSAAVLQGLGLDPREAEGTIFYRGEGCVECNNTGFRGRVGIYELMEVDGPVREAISRNDRGAVECALEGQEAHRTLRESGLAKVRAGVTSLEEVLRVTAEDQEYAHLGTP
ncbi:GspE/PulE family protein [Thiohalorhabdus denitrificans]|uniref:MSHA biogenesis protein MshE n=1 Tax=Thiohalorhabdus denitrificans TaxID=381306 RepID=A0A1G5B424_9GAMM|nr:ATPase, T2SS/T4P/T4SS family [Thiohalorhabdus denitrificans]SCX84770.1 MSHA biogenesis protein MshE [Thiohalorhabdus denitrificans]